MNQTDYWLNESTSSEPISSMWQGQKHQDDVLLQLDDVEQDITIAVEREDKVENIVNSISELQNVFKELTVMVQDQGTVLARIDYNMEQTQVQVHEGRQQLKKAESYKKSNRKMCILILLGSIFSLIFFYVIFKS